MNYPVAIALFLVFIVIYLYNDHKNIKKKDKSAGELQRLENLEKMVKSQGDRINAAENRINEIADIVGDIAEEICAVIPVAGQNTI